MTLIESLYAQGIRALRDPRAAAADVLQLGVPREALAPALFAVVAISAVFNSVIGTLAPSPPVIVTPFQMSVLLLVVLLTFSFGVSKAGQFLGGVGSFPDSLLLMVFLQAMFLAAVALQILLFLISPAVAGLFIMVVMIFLMWIQLNFIAALHGFEGLGRAFGVLLMAVFLTFVLLMFVAPLFITPTGLLTDV